MMKSMEAEECLQASIEADSDDMQAVGQKPITFLRQVMALVTCPSLLSSSELPRDAKDRATRILSSCYGNSIGSYTDGPGVPIIRSDVAKFIERRDNGITCRLEDVFMSAGATDALESLLSLLSTGKGFPNEAGIMIPAPGYPILKELVICSNSYPITYFLDVDNNWDVTEHELRSALDSAQLFCHPRAIVIVNPSNPTGHVLSQKSIESIIKFAKEEDLFIIADEVHQNSVFGLNERFHSFKETLMSMGEPYDEMELASVMSSSKGFASECGFRGGSCEAINLDPEVKEQLVKVISAKSCSTVPGQVAMDVVVNPPLPEDPSYTLFQEEFQAIIGSYRHQAELANDVLNRVEGLRCAPSSGATFVFPRIRIPPKAVTEAKAQGMTADEMYCNHLLRATGISVRPGSDFGQREGHYHFRLSFMQSPIQMKAVLQKIKDFHLKFLEFYSS